jgi:hypothetical protein
LWPPDAGAASYPPIVTSIPDQRNFERTNFIGHRKAQRWNRTASALRKARRASTSLLENAWL